MSARMKVLSAVSLVVVVLGAWAVWRHLTSESGSEAAREQPASGDAQPSAVPESESDHAAVGAVATVGDLTVPVRVGDASLLHGDSLAQASPFTCVDIDGAAWPLGEEIVDASREAAHNDGDARLFNIYDFTYLTAQSAFYSMTPLDEHPDDATCATVMRDMWWMSVFRYETEDAARAALNIDLDAYDYALDNDGVGCWDQHDAAECWGRAGHLVVVAGSHSPVDEHAVLLAEALSALSHAR